MTSFESKWEVPPHPYLSASVLESATMDSETPMSDTETDEHATNDEHATTDSPGSPKPPSEPAQLSPIDTPSSSSECDISTTLYSLLSGSAHASAGKGSESPQSPRVETVIETGELGLATTDKHDKAFPDKHAASDVSTPPTEPAHYLPAVIASSPSAVVISMMSDPKSSDDSQASVGEDSESPQNPKVPALASQSSPSEVTDSATPDPLTSESTEANSKEGSETPQSLRTPAPASPSTPSRSHIFAPSPSTLSRPHLDGDEQTPPRKTLGAELESSNDWSPNITLSFSKPSTDRRNVRFLQSLPDVTPSRPSRIAATSKSHLPHPIAALTNIHCFSSRRFCKLSSSTTTGGPTTQVPSSRCRHSRFFF